MAQAQGILHVESELLGVGWPVLGLAVRSTFASSADFVFDLEASQNPSLIQQFHISDLPIHHTPGRSPQPQSAGAFALETSSATPGTA